MYYRKLSIQKVPLRIFKIAYPAESQAAPTYPQLSVLNGSEDYQLNCSLKILSTAPSAHPIHYMRTNGGQPFESMVDIA